MTIETKSIRLPNGVRLPYVEQGNKTGLPLLLLHGFAGSWRSFQSMLPLLPENLRAIAVTLRGHGNASQPPAGYRLQDYAGDLAAFLEAVDIQAAVFVGHSMGASIALRFAASYPEHTLGLALVSPRASMRDRPGMQELWESKISKLNDPVEPAFVRSFVENSYVLPLAEADREAMLEDSLKVSARVWREGFKAALEDDLLKGVENIQVPTLLAWGEEDETVPQADREAISEAIPGSRRVIYPGAGHSPHVEVPERFAEDLTAFCKTLIQQNMR